MCAHSNEAALLPSGLFSVFYCRVCAFMCSPCARRCTGSCHQGRRADGWGLRGGGSAAEPAGCRLGRSRGQHSGSKSHRRKQTGRGWSQSRRWCHFGPASSLQRRQESGIWQGFQPFKKVHKTQLPITSTQTFWHLELPWLHLPEEIILQKCTQIHLWIICFFLCYMQLCSQSFSLSFLKRL